MRKYFKNFTTLLSGTLISQFVGILLIPILSRLYSPDMFGELSLFISITGIIAILSTLKLNEAIMIAKNPEEINRILGSIIYFSILVLIFSSVVVISVVFLTTSKILVLEHSLLLIILLPLNILGLALYNTSTIYLTKRSLYQNVSKSNIFRATSMNVGQIALSVFPKYNGLLIGNIIGNFAGSYYILNDRNYYYKYINFKNFNYIIEKYLQFPKYNLPQAILNNTSSILPNIMLIIPFGATNVGLYYMVVKLLNLPTTIISNIVTNLFYQDASNRYNDNKNIFSYYLKTIIFLVSIIIVPTFFLIKLGSNIIPTILGNEWTAAGELIPWVSLWTATMFVYTPATKVVIIYTWQKFMLHYNLIVFIGRLILMCIGILYLNFIDTIIYLCIFNTISNLFIIIIVGVSTYRKEKKL